jgi:integrase
VPIYLAANTGMRRGEVVGLPWRNVDLGAARIVVNQQILSVEYGTLVADVKTTNSRRTIDLDPPTVAVLRAWRREQLKQRCEFGSARRGRLRVHAVRRSTDSPRLLLTVLGAIDA